MARRPTKRLSLALECLETRQLLSTTEFAPPAGFVAPDADQMAMLKMVNDARENPQAVAAQYTDGLSNDEKQTAAYYGLDLNAAKQAIQNAKPQQPLAWNSKLAAAAQGQSQDMADHNFQSHNGSDGSDPGTRAQRQGYNGVSIGENGFAYARNVRNAMNAFMADWGNAPTFGHRSHILEPNTPQSQSFREVGFGLVKKTGGLGGVGPLVVTQVFGRQANSKPFLLGAAFHDDNNNGQFDAGEGSANVDVNAVNVQTGQDIHTKTWASGGWQMQLDPGVYRVTGSLNGTVLKTQQITLNDQNQSVNFDTAHPQGDAGNSSSGTQQAQQIQVQASQPPVAQPQVVVNQDSVKAAADKAAADKAAADKAAADKAAADKAAADKAAADKAAADKAAADKAAADKAAADKVAADKAAADKAAADQAAAKASTSANSVLG
ncbi:MAG: CAP domain-containing protein, partial [Isosphaeraceae bacterium]